MTDKTKLPRDKFNDEVWVDDQLPHTLHFAPYAPANIRNELSEFRRNFELINGPTDPHRRYTSQLSARMQNWFLDNFPDLYFEGLPPFYRAFWEETFELHAMNGSLDDCPSAALSFFILHR